ECGLWQWCECGVAEALWEVSGWRIHGDLKGLVIDDLEAFELFDALFCITFDWLEEVRTQLCIGNGIVPRIHKGVGSHVCAVGELPVLQSDGEFSVVVVSLNGLCDFVVRLAISVISHEAGKDRVDDLAAACFV